MGDSTLTLYFFKLFILYCKVADLNPISREKVNSSLLSTLIHRTAWLLRDKNDCHVLFKSSDLKNLYIKITHIFNMLVYKHKIPLSQSHSQPSLQGLLYI